MLCRIFENSAEVYSIFILVQLIGLSARVCICIFHLDLLMKHPNQQVFTLMYVILVAIAELYFYCSAGQMATDASLKFAHSMFEINWFKFPVNVQKILIPMIAYAQQPVYYHGFGVVYLNLSTFLAVSFVFFSHLSFVFFSHSLLI